MKLSDDQVKGFADALMAKMGELKPCQVCGEKERVVPSRTFETGVPPGGRETWLDFPAHLLATKCRNCGYTLLFDAAVYGFSLGEGERKDED
ncbi:MAG: hypothetical protein ACYS47_13635 [Planctomycetota bacterium]|jgi:hypothetical protein